MTDKTARDIRVFHKTGLRKVMKDVTGLRVTGDAIRHMMYHEEKEVEEIAAMAGEIARNANRDTVQEDDIRLANKFRRGRDD